jgi:hypothetical protein
MRLVMLMHALPVGVVCTPRIGHQAHVMNVHSYHFRNLARIHYPIVNVILVM